jgi:hypothetical protein
MDVLNITEEKVDFLRPCEYCGKSFEAEHISDEKDNQQNPN